MKFNLNIELSFKYVERHNLHQLNLTSFGTPAVFFMYWHSLLNSELHTKHSSAKPLTQKKNHKLLNLLIYHKISLIIHLLRCTLTAQKIRPQSFSFFLDFRFYFSSSQNCLMFRCQCQNCY